MSVDAHTVEDFYGTPRGGVAARLVRERLAALWPDMRGRSVLGLGYALPYLRPWRTEAARCIAAVPGARGVTRWPLGAASLCCAAEEDALPFPDLCFDRILLVHGLEAADNARRLLREVWRVLKDDGRLLVVAPNRNGLWAHMESTPFGQGQPYTPGQLGRLLAASLFRVERRDWALYVPPVRMQALLQGAEVWDHGLRGLVPQLGGVTLAEAVKDVYAAIPVPAVPRKRLILVDAA